MGLKDCKITLDNQWNTYYPGQTINGQVEFIFDAPKKVRGIAIRFKGEAETSWNESCKVKDADGHMRDSTTSFSAKEEYFTISYYLLGSKSSGDTELPAGTHTYPFTCALPPTLPSSFEGELGFVRYTVKVTLDRPWKFDQDSKMAFTVVSHMDLNLNPEYRKPIEIHMEKNFCCCWCRSGPLLVDVLAPVSGYCSGQTIPLEISCENGSNVDITYIKLHLTKLVKFRSQNPHGVKEQRVEIAKITLDPTKANSSRNWQELIEIPPLPPSNLTNCSIIDLDYELMVEVNPSGMHVTLQETRPVILGTVPIAGFSPPPIGQKPGQDTIVENLPETPLLPDDPNMSPYPAQPGENFPGGMYPSEPSAPYPTQPAAAPYPMQPAPGAPPAAAMGGFPASAPAIEGPSLYPTLSQPVFREGQFAARSIQDAGDTQHTFMNAGGNFAPRYPTYGFMQQ